MKKQLKFIFKVGIFIFLTSFLMTNCQTEDVYVKNNENRITSPINKMNFNEFLTQKNIEGTKKKLDDLKKSNFSNTSLNNKGVLIGTINIDSTSINQIVLSGITSYTFGIIKEDLDPSYFENLIIQTDSLGQTKAYILKYIPTGVFELNAPFIGTRILTPVDLDTNPNNKITICETITTYTNHYLCDDVQNLINCDYQNTTSQSETSCSSSGNVGGFSWTSSGEISSNNQTTGSGGGIGIVTAPYGMPADQLRKKDFLMNLDEDQDDCYNSLNNDQKEDILDYIGSLTTIGTTQTNSSNANTQEEQFNEVEDLMAEMCGNPNMTFDVEKSLKSPANIDVTAIDSTTTEGRIFDCVFDKLSKSPKFKNLYNAIFNDTNKINVKFEIADLNSITKAGDTHPTYSYVGNQVTGVKNTIRINSYTLNNNSTLYVANAIIHEMLHAYLNVQQIGLGTNIYDLDNYDTLGDILVQDANNTINIITSNATTSSHEFMFDYMIPAFTEIYNEILSELVNQSDLDYNSNVTMPGTNNLFNVSDLLYYLATGGLDKDKNGINNSNYMSEIGNFPNLIAERTEYLFKVKSINEFSKICN
jgi:hypothetical protein